MIPIAPAPEGGVPTAPPAPEPTEEQTAVISDLHWLVHQGHVIEFANGVLETAKKPLAKPPKPESTCAITATAGLLARALADLGRKHAFVVAVMVRGRLALISAVSYLTRMLVWASRLAESWGSKRTVP